MTDQTAPFTPPAAEGAAPVCKFDEGCHRVVACEPGCGTPWSTADRATLRECIAAALLARIKQATVSKTQPFDGMTSLLAANEFDLADAVLPVLPAPADRAAVLREAANFYDRLLADMGAAVECDPHYWQAIRRVAVELRRMADETPQPASTAPLAAGLPLVKGRCPACNEASLFLGNGGYVTCSHADCPEPDAASTVLEQPAVETQQPEAAEGPTIPRATALREAVTAMEELMADGEHEPGALVERVREMADEAAAAQQPKETRPPTAYSDGTGRTYCLPCAPTVGADVPLTINDVDHWDLCPSCGRHVVDVARAAEEPTS